MRTHLDLFSGIGGFALAAQANGFETVAFCEIDPYAQQVLIEKFGAVLENSKFDGRGPRGTKCERLRGRTSPVQSGSPIIHPDIFTLNGTDYAGVDLVTGGFPCQPFSLAGKRRGAADDRALWPEMFRVIREAEPAAVLAENVPGIINMELDRCLSDLEGIGYSVWPIVVPACAVDARHRRDRVWIVANRSGFNGRSRSESRGSWIETSDSREDVADTKHATPSRQRQGGIYKNVSDSSMRCEQRSGPQRDERKLEAGDGTTPERGRHWLPEPGVGGTLDGLPPWLDRNKGLTMESHKRIVAYGQTTNQSPAQVLQILRSGNGSDAVQRKIGGQGSVSSQEVLLTYLCQLQREAETLGDIPLESQKISEEQMRVLRTEDKPSCPSHRPRSKKRSKEKHPDSLHVLSSLLALDAEQAWGAYRFQNAKAVLTNWKDGWEDGFRRVAHGVSNRAHRLRALGNAIVPQVAQEIIRCMFQDGNS